MVENCSNSNFTSFLGRFRDISIGALMGESRQSEIEYLELGMLILNSYWYALYQRSIKDINENLGTFIIVKRCDLNYVLYSDSFHYASSHLKLALASVVGVLSNYFDAIFFPKFLGSISGGYLRYSCSCRKITQGR